MKKQILSLGKIPNRGSLTPENKMMWHVLYGRKRNIYRVIHCVVEKRKVVEVLHIRHGARKRFRGSELK